MSDPTGSAGRGRIAEDLARRGGRAEPEAPFVIAHREALIYMLCQAAELEHGIVCQYLFAAFSLKQREDEGLTAEELEAVTRWRRTIAHVATEEMLHLALVQNVLSAIGAAPHLTRPNLPAPAHHYPAGVSLTLVPSASGPYSTSFFSSARRAWRSKVRKASTRPCTRRCL
jgi:hypothetical protein